MRAGKIRIDTRSIEFNLYKHSTQRGCEEDQIAVRAISKRGERLEMILKRKQLAELLK